MLLVLFLFVIGCNINNKIPTAPEEVVGVQAQVLAAPSVGTNYGWFSFWDNGNIGVIADFSDFVIDTGVSISINFPLVYGNTTNLVSGIKNYVVDSVEITYKSDVDFAFGIMANGATGVMYKTFQATQTTTVQKYTFPETHFNDVYYSNPISGTPETQNEFSGSYPIIPLSNNVGDLIIYDVKFHLGRSIYLPPVEFEMQIKDSVSNRISNTIDLHQAQDSVKFYDLFSQFNNRMNVLEANQLTFAAMLQNKALDPAQTIDIEAAAQDTGYVITNPIGGQVVVSYGAVLLGLGTCVVNQNAVQVFTNTGLLGLTGGSFVLDVIQGDRITTTGALTVEYIPYVSTVAGQKGNMLLRK